MRREIVVCDVCEEQTKHPQAITIQTGRSCDAAGSMSDDTSLFEFCPKCTTLVFNRICQRIYRQSKDSTYKITPYGVIEEFQAAQKSAASHKNQQKETA